MQRSVAGLRKLLLHCLRFPGNDLWPGFSVPGHPRHVQHVKAARCPYPFLEHWSVIRCRWVNRTWVGVWCRWVNSSWFLFFNLNVGKQDMALGLVQVGKQDMVLGLVQVGKQDMVLGLQFERR